MISLLLAIALLLSSFGGFNEVFAREPMTGYIGQVDVEALVSGYESAFLSGEYTEAIDLSNTALDEFEKSLESVEGLEVADRVQLLVPSIVVEATDEAIEEVKRMPYVVNVFENTVIYEPEVDRKDIYDSETIRPMMTGSNDLIGNAKDDLKYDGRGQVLAVIDSNMDPSHKAFYLSDGVDGKLNIADVDQLIEGNKLNAKKNAIKQDDKWASKIPFGYNYMRKDALLNPDLELEAHGQHVSGTMAGNHVEINRQDWRGVAPNAQLLMMNVMDQGRTYDHIFLQAMQDALVFGVSAVNMSLGSTKGVPSTLSKVMETAINNGYNANTNFVIAAGNEGAYKGDMSIDNPDYGNIGSPSIATNAITVSSIVNKIRYTKGLTHDGEGFPYEKSGTLLFTNGEYDYVYCEQGLIDDEKGINQFDGLD